MNNVTWILDEQCFDDNLPELKDEITRQGCNYITGKTIPFGGYELHSSLFDLAFAYGSLQFCSKINRDLRQNPNLLNTEVFCNLPQFACSYYYPRLSRYLFNQEHAFLPYGELIDKEEWIFKTFGIDDCVFMRPSSGFKEFSGQVYEKRYWKGTIEVSNTQIQPEDLVVISTPKNISAEYRVIIGPNGPITSSLTHVSRKLCPSVILEEEEKYIFNYVNKVLDNTTYEPDPFWVIDVVCDSEDNLSILEVNSMSCSGFYKCDLSKIVKAIKDYFNAWNEL